MDYSPKLRKVMSEIEEIIQREGIEAVVLLHNMEEKTNHFVEFLIKVDNEKSALFIEGQCLRIKTKSNDPKVEYSAGMLKAISDVMLKVGSNLKSFSDSLNKLVNIDFRKGSFLGNRDN